MDVTGVANREDHYEDAGVGFADQPSPFFLRCRVGGVGCDESEGIIKGRNGFGERDAVLRPVHRRLPLVPVEPYFRYVLKC